MNRQTHVIRRQTLELRLADKRDAAGLQAEIHALFGKRVVAVMDEVMTAQSPAKEVLRIGRLELDLGRIDPSSIEQQLCERVREALDLALSRELAQAVTPERDGDGYAPGPAADDVSLRSPVEDTELEAMIHYLRTGLLPWWWIDREGFEVAVVFDRLLTDDCEALLSRLRRLPAQRTARRLLRQLALPTQIRLLQAMAPDAQAQIQQAMVQLQGLPEAFAGVDIEGELSRFRLALMTRLLRKPPASAAEIDGIVLDSLSGLSGLHMGNPELFLFQVAQAARERLPSTAALHHWLNLLGRRFTDIDLAAMVEAGTLPTDRAAKPMPSEGRAADMRSHSAAESADEERPEVAGSTVSSHEHSQTADEGLANVTPADARTHEPAAPVSGEDATALQAALPDLAEGLYVDNAGLVLLWPYLTRFFHGLNLTDAADFLSGTARERAVLLLEYLVLGETAYSEHRLLLNKLLCGWPLLEPVGITIDLSAGEAAEAEELLQSVIGHWQALGNSSIRGLRETFLLREGRLQRDDMGWLLTVNRTGFDVLLDRLPWAIGLVRLPWMADALRVEW